MLPIVYENEDIIAINKPHGLLVHKSLIAKDVKENAVDLLNEQVNQKVVPIHRLDRKTSGVLLFGKNSDVVNYYQSCLSNSNSIKKYLAIVRGWFPEKATVNKPIPDKNNRLKDAETQFECIKKFELNWPNERFPTMRFSLVAAYPKTGRMHQIRRHLSHLRHPIVCDRPHGCNKINKYFLEKFNFKTMLLHAQEVQLYLTESGEKIKIEAPLSEDFQFMLKQFKVDSVGKV